MAPANHKRPVQLSFQCKMFWGRDVICLGLALSLVLGDVEVSAGGIVAEGCLARGEVFLALLLTLVRADEIEVLCDRSAH